MKYTTLVKASLAMAVGFIVSTASVTHAELSGAGTEASPFEIWTVADLRKLDELVDGGENFSGVYFKQMADIDFAGISDWCGIGTSGGSGKAFSGIYDGDGHSILNLTTTQTGNYSGILFHNVDNGEVKNLIVSVSVNASGGFSVFGGASASVFSNVTVRGSIMGTHHTGGFTSFGQWSDAASTFIDCTNEAAVASSKSAGGFQGKPQTGATYIRCVNKGTIGCEGKMGGDGGLSAFASSASPHYTDCVNEGVVAGNFTQLGGIGSLNGVNKVRADKAAFGSSDIDCWFAAVEGNVATIISTNDLVKGNTYLYVGRCGGSEIQDENKIVVGYTQHDVFTLAGAGDWIKIDNAFGISTNYMHVLVAEGLTLEVTEDAGVLTYAAKGQSSGYEDKEGDDVPSNVVSWLETNHVAPETAKKFTNVELADSNLLNLDLNAIANDNETVAHAYTFTVKSITTVEDKVQVVVELDRGDYDNGAINGLLKLEGKASLGAGSWSSAGASTSMEGAFANGCDTETFTFDAGANKFFKAEIVPANAQ